MLKSDENKEKISHTYMVSYVYNINNKPAFGSLVLDEEVDTITSSAKEIAYFHKALTDEISEYQGHLITILNIVRFN